jgi:hypothetical protein
MHGAALAFALLLRSVQPQISRVIRQRSTISATVRLLVLHSFIIPSSARCTSLSLLLLPQKTGRQPDFNSKAKDSDNRRMGLWIDSNNTPEWVINYLLPGGRQRGGNRSGGSSGYNNSSYGNQGMGSADAYMPEEASSEVEASWMDLCRNYRGWFDNRANVSVACLVAGSSCACVQDHMRIC